MSASVCCENLVVEVFDTETKSCDADLFERLQFCFLQRARLTFERHFFRVRPAHVTIQTVDEIVQLFLAHVRRSAAAEIREPKLSTLEGRHAAVDLILLDERVEIDLDLGSVLVCVDFEVAEQAALPAERNVNIET